MTNPNIPNNADNKKFIVYTSSAGSGKTYTLSRFFIRLLLQNDNPSYFRTIAALTFTNKAANEMKERIFNNLVVLSQDVSKITDEKKRNETSRLLNDYSSYIGISKEKIQEQSAKIVSEILHNYTDLTVQTIDKFTHKIIRPFSRDLNISPDFSIELGEDDIIKKSVDLLLQKSSGDEFLSKILLDFAYYKVEEGKRFQTFEDDLNSLASVFKKEDAISYLNNYREYTLSFFFEKKQEIKQKLTDVTKLITSEAKQCSFFVQIKRN
jgi:ATP-dependent exoDNAse (exonuclease V) beta subunit